MPAYEASKKDWYLDVFGIPWVENDDKASLVINEIGQIKGKTVHLTVFRPTWAFRFAYYHDVDTIFERIFGSGTGGVHATLELDNGAPENAADQKETGIHCYVDGPNQGRDAEEKHALQDLLDTYVTRFKANITTKKTQCDEFIFLECDDIDKMYDFLFRDMKADGFEKIATIASERHGIKVVYPNQSDTALQFATASVHPMQSLQNTYQRLVRDASRGLSGDAATTKEAEELGKYFYFHAAPPTLMGMAKDAPADVTTQLEDIEKKLNTLKRELPDMLVENSDKHLTALYKELWDLRNLFNASAALPDKKKAKSIPGIAATEKHLKGFTKAMAAAKINPMAADAYEVIRARLGKAHLEISFAIAGMCSIQNFHTIEPFYLFRLLVKFQIQSDKAIQSAMRTKVSSSLTSLLHNGKHVPWLFEWLRDKLVELDGDLARACPTKGPASKRWPTGEPAVVFFLKGGRAAKYLLQIERQGENDWDTNIVINPYLRASEWYKNFLAVHNTVLAFLEKAKREFCVRVFQADAYDGLVKSILEMEADDKKERDKARATAQSTAEMKDLNMLAALGGELLSDEDLAYFAKADQQLKEMDDAEKRAHYQGSTLEGMEFENCKAELIDIGIPRRDTVEAFEQWANVCPRVIRCPDNIPVPGHLYYIAEYVMMIREAFMDKCISVPKTPKRVIRLLEVLNMDALDPFVAEERKHIPSALKSSIDAVEKLPPPEKRMLTILLAQFSEAYDLALDGDLAKCFNTEFSKDLANRKTKAVYPAAFTQAIAESDKKKEGYADPHKAVADAIGYAQWISQEFAKHLQDERAKFIQDHSKELIHFVKAIYTGSLFAGGEDLEVQFAVAGAFAANLHARYARFERMEELEPIRRLDLKIYCKPGSKPATVLELIKPLIDTYIKDPTTPNFLLTELPEGKLALFWPEVVSFSSTIKYKPMVVKITVEVRDEDWPQLSFIKGLPVLGLRDLVWEYKRYTGSIEETFTQRGLKTAIDCLIDILTRFENPNPGGAWDLPAMPPAQAQQGAPVEADDPPLAPVTVKVVAGLEFVPQQKSNWCWAAASLMMRRFYLRDTSTLDDIVREIYPGLEDAQSALRLPRLKPEGAVEGRLLSWSDIKNLLDANKPFVIAKAGHYWTCYGYEESATVKNLLYWDPLPTATGTKTKMTYAQYTSFIQDRGATAQNFEIQPKKVLLPIAMDRARTFAKDSTGLFFTSPERGLRVAKCEMRVRHTRNKLGDVGAVILRKEFIGLPAIFSWDMKVDDANFEDAHQTLTVRVEVEATLSPGEEGNPIAGDTFIATTVSKEVATMHI